MRLVKKACVSSSAIPSWWSTQPSRVTLMLKVRSPMVSSVLDTRQAAGHLAPRARVQAQLSALAKNSFKRKRNEPDHVPNVFPTPLRRAKHRASLSKLTWPRSCPAITHGHEPTGETYTQTAAVNLTFSKSKAQSSELQSLM